MATIKDIKNCSTVYVEMPVESLTREMVQNILHTEYFHVNCFGTDEQLEIVNETDWNTAMEKWRTYGVKAVAINDAHWYDAVYPVSEAYEKKCDEWKAAKEQGMEAINNYD